METLCGTRFPFTNGDVIVMDGNDGACAVSFGGRGLLDRVRFRSNRGLLRTGTRRGTFTCLGNDGLCIHAFSMAGGTVAERGGSRSFRVSASNDQSVICNRDIRHSRFNVDGNAF